MGMVTQELPDRRGIPAMKAAVRFSSRAAGLDVMRFVAAAFVVWIHVPREGWWAPSTSLSRWAVPFFTFMAGYAVVASIRSRPDEPLGTFTWRRFLRLYVPFLGWGVVYLALRLAKRGSGSVPITWDGVLISGPAQQLWFLPFVFVASVAAGVVLKQVIGDAPRERAAAVVLAFVGLTIVAAEAICGFQSPAGEFATQPWRMTVNLSYQALPSLLWGLAAALWLRRGIGELNGPVWIAGAGLVAVTVATWLGWRDVPTVVKSMGLENVAGVGAVLLAVGLPGEGAMGALVRRIAPLGALAYGIYLAHIIFTQACMMLSDRMRVAPSFGRDLAVMTIALVGSALLCQVLRRHRWTSWLVP